MICRSLLSSLNEEKAWELSEGILKFAERIYLEMEKERALQIPHDAAIALDVLSARALLGPAVDEKLDEAIAQSKA